MATENGSQEPSAIDDPRLLELKSDLHNVGLDIFHPFLPQWYNDSLRRDNLQNELICLPETGRGFLIGNTKHLWPHFKEWYKRQSPCLQDPLDTYCRECIERSFRKYFDDSSSFTIYWSQKTQPDKLVSMQRVAMESGFAYHDPTTQLTIHPLFGPWNSYRAVVILHDDCSIPATCIPPPSRIPCLLTPQEEKCAKEATKHALEVSDTRNLCHQLHGGGANDPDIQTVCKAWIAMRDCIQRGKAEYRYDEDQLMYHYTKDTKHLK